MLISRRPVTVLAVVLLAASAGAQTFQHDGTIPWDPALGSPGVLNRTVAVDASGDGRLDLFVRGGPNDNQIVFFDGPWTGAGGLTTGIACADFDAAPGQGPNDIAALAFVGSTGLCLLARNALTSETFEFQSPTNLSEGPWINAKLVRTGNVDGAGSLDYVGVKSDGRTLILRANGGPTNLEVNVGRDILDVVLVDWGPAGASEIAVLSAQGVEIRSASLAAVDAISPSPGYVSKAIAALAVPNENDRLAWIGTKVATGTTHFAVLKRLATRVENLRELDASDATASRILTGDYDADGDTDVVISRTSSIAPWYITSSGTIQSMPWFGAKSTVDMGEAGPTNAGAPVLARFANEPYLELVIPTFETNTAELDLFVFEPVERLLGADVFLFAPVQNYDVLFLDDDAVPADPQVREMRFQVNFQDEVLASQGLPDNRRLEVTIFQGVAGNNVSNLIDKRYWIAWPQAIVDTTLTFHDIRFKLPVGATQDCTVVPRFIEVRQVRVTSNFAVIESGPTYTFGIARHTGDFLQYWPGFGEESVLLKNPQDQNSSFPCQQSFSTNPVHASAIVIRRKPNPISQNGVPLPIPDEQTGGVISN